MDVEKLGVGQVPDSGVVGVVFDDLEDVAAGLPSSSGLPFRLRTRRSGSAGRVELLHQGFSCLAKGKVIATPRFMSLTDVLDEEDAITTPAA